MTAFTSIPSPSTYGPSTLIYFTWDTVKFESIHTATKAEIVLVLFNIIEVEQKIFHMTPLTPHFRPTVHVKRKVLTICLINSSLQVQDRAYKWLHKTLLFNLSTTCCFTSFMIFLWSIIYDGCILGMKWFGALFTVTSSWFEQNKWSDMSHLHLLRFCQSSMYSALMMQNDTRCAVLQGGLTQTSLQGAFN